MKKNSKLRLLTLALTSSVLIGQAYAMPQFDNENFQNVEGLNPEDETELGSFFLLYQLALKNQKEKLFGEDDLCFDYSKDQGDFKLSIVVNSKSFETGAATYNYNDPSARKKYENLGKVLNIFETFFQKSKTTPTVTVNSFADAQNNSMSSYTSGASQILDGSNEKLNTTSKASNYLLAKERGQNFASQDFFPKSWSSRSIAPYHSPKGEDELSNDQKDCPSRRSVMLDLEFNPYLGFSQKAGEFSPKFDMVSGEQSRNMLVAAAIDAAEKAQGKNATQAAQDLAPACRTESAKNFLNGASAAANEYRNSIFSIASAQQEELKSKREYWSSRAERSEGASKKNALEKLESVEALSKFYQDLIDQKAAGVKKKDLKLNKLYPALKAGLELRDPRLKSLYIKLAGASGGTISQSTHGADCFSSAAFYDHEVEKSINSFIKPLDNFRGSNGKLKLSYKKENMPFDTHNQSHGFYCDYCHNGVGLDGQGLKLKSRVPARLGSEHADSQNQWKALKADSDPFKVGAGKSLKVIVIPGCRTSADGSGFDSEYVKQNGRPININKVPFDKELSDVGPDDCIFTPKFMSACRVKPSGDGKKSPESRPKKVISFFNLDKMDKQSLVLNDSMSVLENLVMALGPECGVVSPEGRPQSPQELVESLSCSKRGMKAPTPGHHALKDCR